jgi:hypothetical protein
MGPLTGTVMAEYPHPHACLYAPRTPRLLLTRYPSTGWYYSVGVGWHAMGSCLPQRLASNASGWK